jgi:hypothetical protein
MPSPCLEFYGLGMGPLNRLFYGAGNLGMVFRSMPLARGGRHVTYRIWPLRIVGAGYYYLRHCR